MRTSLDSLPKVNGGPDRKATKDLSSNKDLVQEQRSSNIQGKDWIFSKERQEEIEKEDDHGVNEYLVVEEVVVGPPKGPSRF